MVFGGHEARIGAGSLIHGNVRQYTDNGDKNPKKVLDF